MAATDSAFDKGYLKGFDKGYLKGFEKGFTKGGGVKSKGTHSQGQDDIPRAGANASNHHEPMIDLTGQDVLDCDRGGEGKGKARNRDRSRSRDAKGKGKEQGECDKGKGVGVRKVKEALEELGYEYMVTGRPGAQIMWARTPPDMTESQLVALRAKILESRALRM